MYYSSFLIATGTLFWLPGGGTPNLPHVSSCLPLAISLTNVMCMYAVMISSVLAQSATTCTTPYQALAKEPSLSIAKQTVDAAGLKGAV